MFRLIFYLALSWGAYYLVRSLLGSVKSAVSQNRTRADALDDEMWSCPECETFFPSRLGVSRRAGGARRSFCCDACAEKFASRGGPPGADG